MGTKTNPLEESKAIQKRALIRYYSEHLAMKVIEIEKLQGEAMKLEKELANLEKD